MKKDRFHLGTYLATTGSRRTIEHAERNQVLFAQGKRGNAVFYILSGAVGLTVAADGKERIIALLGPGSFAGKECIASNWSPSPSSGRTLTACTLFRIERSEMLRLTRAHDRFAVVFLDYLLRRIASYQEVIKDHLFVSSEMRLARTLLQLTNISESSETEMAVPYLGQTILAEVVGTTRSRVSFFMNRFRSLGLIAYKRRGPVLVNRAKLSAWLTEGRRAPWALQHNLASWRKVNGRRRRPISLPEDPQLPPGIRASNRS